MAFQLKSDRIESTNKTIRFRQEMIDRIEERIVGRDISFSSFVIQACEYVLREMEEQEKADSDK